jgi:RNA polymerase sigma-70 factor (ECF subfamily)
MPSAEFTDIDLVIRCQLGDEAAWRQLVERWQPRLWRFIGRMIGDRTVAEDVLQTVWLRVIRSLMRLREPERWPAWVFGIARTTIADRFRQQYREPANDFLDDVAASDVGSEQFMLAEYLDTGLERLHPTDREAVVLHYLEELPVSDVAAICGVPTGTIKSRLHRARQVLRRALQNWERLS